VPRRDALDTQQIDTPALDKGYLTCPPNISIARNQALPRIIAKAHHSYRHKPFSRRGNLP
jgi:hypothetical protein